MMFELLLFLQKTKCVDRKEPCNYIGDGQNETCRDPAASFGSHMRLTKKKTFFT